MKKDEQIRCLCTEKTEVEKELNKTNKRLVRAEEESQMLSKEKEELEHRATRERDLLLKTQDECDTLRKEKNQIQVKDIITPKPKVWCGFSLYECFS